MDILADLENYINEFNQANNIEFNIDSIRIEFNKQYKKDKLDQLGKWKKINKNDKTIMDKLKKRLNANEITSAYQLENYNIYYYNSNKDKPKYRKATMVMFGLKQYHKEPPPYSIVKQIVSILKNISNIDLCLDLPYKPNLDEIEKYHKLKRYFDKKLKAYTNSYYINDTNMDMIEKIVIYDKQEKNNLSFTCWRIEVLITIPNIKYLSLPIYELKDLNYLIVQSNKILINF